MACTAHAAGDASSNDSMGGIHAGDLLVRLRAISIEPDVTAGGVLGTLGVGMKF